MNSILFTSRIGHYHKEDDKYISNEMNDINGIKNIILGLLDKRKTLVYVASSSDDFDSNDGSAKLLFDSFNLSGIGFDNYICLDDRNMGSAEAYIQQADLVFLSGGDTYIQNEFFRRIYLKDLLLDFNGLIIGQSAGALNLSWDVYNSPEEGVGSEPIYFEGLGLSRLNIEPHFILDDSSFDDNMKYQREHLLKESFKRNIIGLCDGSYVLESNDEITVYGESYLICDGNISLLCNDGESKVINEYVYAHKTIITIEDDEDYLRQVSDEVSFDDKELDIDLKVLKNFCKYNRVFALASIQIGICKRIVYVKNTDLDKISKDEEIPDYDEAKVLINPVIVLKEGLTYYWEACASGLDYTGYIARPYRITVEYQDRYGKNVTEVFEGFESTILCHEIDHLDGILHMDIAEKIVNMPRDERGKLREKEPYKIIFEDGNYEDLKIGRNS